jgi:hypothetical protein
VRRLNRKDAPRRVRNIPNEQDSARFRHQLNAGLHREISDDCAAIKVHAYGGRKPIHVEADAVVESQDSRKTQGQ